mgnify:CR=1 FL=1
MKLYDDYKDGRIDCDLYKQRAEKISVQLDEIKRKIEDAKNSKKLLEQNELSDKIKLKDFLEIQKFISWTHECDRAGEGIHYAEYG